MPEVGSLAMFHVADFLLLSFFSFYILYSVSKLWLRTSWQFSYIRKLCVNV